MILFVENQRLDVSNEISALLTFTIDDLTDFGAKNSSFSKTIVLPGSIRNNKVLGHIFEVTGSNPFDSSSRNILTNFNAAKRSDAIIFVDNIQVFKGTFRLLKIIDDNGRIEYECQVVGELGGLVAALGAKKLEDLDFSEYDHTFDEINITNSWSSINGKGYYYPFIDYAGTSTNKKDWDISTFRPALYAKEYIEKIFSAAGYRLSSKILDTNRFRSLGITSTRKESATTYVTRSFDSELRPRYYYPYFAGKISIKPQTHRNLFEMTGAQDLKWVQGNGFTLTHSIDIVLAFEEIATLPANVDVTITLFKNGTAIAAVADTFVTGLSTYESLLTISQTTTADTGDVFNLQITFTGGGGENFYCYLKDGFWTIDNDPAILYSSVYGALVSINNTIPSNILQKDFLSSIAKLFNLLIFEDNQQNKLLKIEPYVDFYDLGGGVRLLDNGDDGIISINDDGDGLLLDDGEVNAVDWSYRMNRARPVEIIPMSELNARYYDFAYKDDSDFWNEEYKKKHNETYGNLRFDSEFDFSKEVDKVEIIFASMPLVQYTSDGDDKIMPAIYKRSGNATTEDRKETAYEGSIRIFQAKRMACATYNIKNGSDVITSVSQYGYAGHFDDPTIPTSDLNFGATKELYYSGLSTSNNQFNLYWSAYMSEITDKDSRLLVAWFRLSEVDILNLDFSKFIWIDGNLYRLNKIEDWNATSPDECKVSLLRTIQTVFS